MPTFMDRVFWGNTVQSYLLVAGGIMIAMLVVNLVKNILLKRIKKWTEKTHTEWDDVLLNLAEKFVVPYLYLAINFALINQLNLSTRIAKVLDASFAAITAYFAVRIINRALHLGLANLMERRNETPERIRQLSGVLKIIKALVWFTGLIFLMDNLGYDVTAIITGLGVGGIAIALAAQAILGDLFSYFVIFFDKPFEIGDFISVGDKKGTIEYIGIKTTRIRTLNGEQLIMSNTNLTSSAVHNFKRMEERRIVLQIGVTYQTPVEKLRWIPDNVKQIISGKQDLRFDRCHLSGFGDFSINFETVYYVLNSDYLIYMNLNQAICLDILEKFEQNGIQFAYPTQTLFFEK